MNTLQSKPPSQDEARGRLTKDQFIALRSLAKGHWVQGSAIQWKFNRTWLSVHVSNTFLDTVNSLQIRGLAIKGKCCLKCKRDVYLLTEAGLQLVTHANSPYQNRQVKREAAIKKQSITSRLLYWLGR
ncbi:hypothetical protein P5706_34340 [Pseudomonas sp. ChxA]|uniref:hypothetical protein n=1 Tax=Pseudomonas TaxID=286 RepID=UPI00128FE389|nr:MULTISPECIES: hypothetical protein [Pseudomonas]MBJ2203762.1 hypothetical protein [Pseudomonas carnis]MDL2189250.1 hypothetical protein [Pseudomonas sp. ChxA]